MVGNNSSFNPENVRYFPILPLHSHLALPLLPYNKTPTRWIFIIMLAALLEKKKELYCFGAHEACFATPWHALIKKVRRRGGERKREIILCHDSFHIRRWWRQQAKSGTREHTHTRSRWMMALSFTFSLLSSPFLSLQRAMVCHVSRRLIAGNLGEK